MKSLFKDTFPEKSSVFHSLNFSQRPRQRPLPLIMFIMNIMIIMIIMTIMLIMIIMTIMIIMIIMMRMIKMIMTIMMIMISEIYLEKNMFEKI